MSPLKWHAGMLCRAGLIDPGHVYDILPEIISALNVFSLGFCVFLYLKVSARRAAACARSCSCR